MSQTNYNEQDKAGLGLIADLTPYVVDSFIAETALIYGRFVVRGADKVKQCKLPAAATDITARTARLGIVTATQFIETPRNTTTAAPPQYTINKTVNVMSWGRVWVECETNTVDTTKGVFVRHTAAGALNKVGVFADAAGTGLAQITEARWMTVDQLVNGRNLAMVEIRL